VTQVATGIFISLLALVLVVGVTNPQEGTMSKLLANVSLLTAAVTAALTLLVAFGVNISPDQHTAILGAITAVLAIFGALAHPAIPVGNTNP
jgi:uncharacterized membrane protein